MRSLKYFLVLSPVIAVLYILSAPAIRIASEEFITHRTGFAITSPSSAVTSLQAFTDNYMKPYRWLKTKIPALQKPLFTYELRFRAFCHSIKYGSDGYRPVHCVSIDL